MPGNKKDLQSAILRTLCYADIFDYPLTAKEIFRYLIWLPNAAPSASSVRSVLLKSYPNIERVGKYFTLKGRSKTVQIRKKRQKYAKEKMEIAKRVGKWLKRIPTIKMVALTGALAMGNSDEGDDIDLLLITSRNRLWFTRLFTVIITETLGVRRRPTKRKSESINDKICLNLWLDETALNVPKPQQNLYTAHEVAQTKPLWSKGVVYEKFLTQNAWIKEYLPNIKIPQVTKPSVLNPQSSVLNSIENLTYRLQLLYMRQKMTSELVTPHSAFFHPRNTSEDVLRKHQERLRQFRNFCKDS